MNVWGEERDGYSVGGDALKPKPGALGGCRSNREPESEKQLAALRQIVHFDCSNVENIENIAKSCA